MVLTITLVNNNGGQQAPAPSDSQEMQWSPNDLAQLMSGQTLTGLLNPDGTITLNSHLIPAQHQNQHQQHHHQLDSVHSHLNTSMQPLNNSMHSPGPTLNTPTTIAGPSATPFQYCRNVKLETNLPNSNSLSNIHAISTGDLSNINIINSNINNNNNNNDINNSALISNNSQSQQPQSGSQVQMQTKKTGQKRLTAKQKQAIQQQQQQLQQTQQVEPMQSPDTRQSQQINSLNPDQVGLRPQQPQVVATVQLPNGQIGQLIAPSGGFWSPNALDLQQLSMAVAAATGSMPQSLSLPISSGQNGMQISSSGNQQQMQMANGHPAQLQHPSVITSGPGLDSSLSQNSGSTISGISRNNLSNSNQRVNQLQFHNGNFQIAQQQNQLQQTSIQASMPQQQSSSHQTNQSLSSVSPHNESDSGALSNQQGKKLKRLACTCPNCRDGDNSRSGGGDKKKQHICHFPDCNKVYGKTSHLRAHLRWHSGERPYICSWAFCGKKFTRSDELQRHRRTHTGEKRFQCQECNKRFMRSDHLSKHLKIHLSSKKCGSTSQQSPLLNSTQTF